MSDHIETHPAVISPTTATSSPSSSPSSSSSLFTTPTKSDTKRLLPLTDPKASSSSKKTISLTYTIVFTFLACTLFLLYSRSSLSSPTLSASIHRSRFPSLLSHFRPTKKNKYEWLEKMVHCDFFHGRWVRDDSYPLYQPTSCPHIDESFDCARNGRPDRNYDSFKWKPYGCDIPRLNAKHMLKILKGKRLVYVGDSLNRNMWESMVCLLRNAVKDKSRVFEASKRIEFRTEGSYSFVFEDYNCSVEFFSSPFLVQQWEVLNKNGSKKETLRLDLIETSSDKYSSADFIVFNTGHWWTHEKTAKGKDYYQEGDHVYSEMSASEAFQRALRTWGRWVDAKTNSSKTAIFFRGYSFSHFGGGKWNTGGQCHRNVEPFKNETSRWRYPKKMRVLEKIIKEMKTHISYLNVTRMTNFRKDGHPSMYRKQNPTKEEQLTYLTHQDCSHWCLPGVPDVWNELLYAQILVRNYHRKQRMLHEKQTK
ncbi:PC-Esterase [Dillenia turbinata]|uniref:PC-Esterase n=1 Tax=Dillenia turbinata TaxID=194707 RepID=A0AAN8VZD6_9MAGN